MVDKKRTKRISVKGNVGASINEIALQLKAANPQMKFEDAQTQAKDVKNAQATIANNGSALRHSLLTRVLGKSIGGSISASMANRSDMERSAQVLANHQKTLQAADPSTQLQKDIKDLQAKINFLYTEVKQHKAERMAQPAVASFHAATVGASQASAARVANGQINQNQAAMADAVEALQGLGFKKQTAAEMVKHTPPGLDTAEIVKAALKAYDNMKNGKVVRLSNAEVPAAVQEVRASVPAAAIPAPSEASPMAEPTTVTDTRTAAPTQNTKVNDDQAEAARIKAAQHEFKKEKEQKERDEEIEKKLDAIMKGLMTKNLNQLISGLLSKALEWLGKGILKAVTAAGRFIIQNALKAIGKIGGAIKAGGKQLWKLITGGAEGLEGAVVAGATALEATTIAGAGTVMYGAYRMASGKDALQEKSAVDKYLDQWGIKVERDGKGFTNGKYLIGGKEVDAKDLTQAQKDVIGFSQIAADPALGRDHETMEAKARMKAHPEQYTKSAIDKVASTAAPTQMLEPITVQSSRSAMASNNITPEPKEETPEQLPEITVNAPVVNKTIVAGNQGGDGSVLIKTRNDESSFAGPTAAMYDHPVSFAGVYNM